MGLLDKLFGRRRNSSSGTRDEIKIVDLRLDKERKIERQAQSSLGGRMNKLPANSSFSSRRLYPSMRRIKGHTKKQEQRLIKLENICVRLVGAIE